MGKLSQEARPGVEARPVRNKNVFHDLQARLIKSALSRRDASSLISLTAAMGGVKAFLKLLPSPREGLTVWGETSRRASLLHLWPILQSLGNMFELYPLLSGQIGNGPA